MTEMKHLIHANTSDFLSLPPNIGSDDKSNMGIHGIW